MLAPGDGGRGFGATARTRAAIAVHVCDLDRIDVSPAAEILDPSERVRWADYRDAWDRRRFVVGRWMLRALVAEALGIGPREVALVVGPAGKPRLSDSSVDVRFSVSHSERRVLVSLAVGVDVGVDIERLRAVPDARLVAERYFDRRESVELDAHDPPARDAAFLRLWVRKEAYLKTRGRGFATGLTTPVFLPVEARTFGGHDAQGDWALADVALGGGFVAAVAAAGQDLEVTVTQWHPAR